MVVTDALEPALMPEEAQFDSVSQIAANCAMSVHLRWH
jgi:hypothetical protein